MKESNDKQTLLYVKIFILIVVIAALVSIVYKTISLIQNSYFKTGNFNTLIIGKNVWLVHIDPVKNQTVTVELLGVKDKLLNKSAIVQAATLGVLVDGEVVMDDGGEYKSPSDFLARPGFKFRNVNDFDTLKMIFYSKVIPSDRQTFRSVKPATIPYLGTGDSVLKSFGDEQILDEEKSIEVINSTDMDGFGTKVGNSLKSIGLNVVRIDSSSGKKSAVFSSDSSSLSVERVVRALDIPAKPLPAGSVADIRLVIGKDLLKNNPINK